MPPQAIVLDTNIVLDWLVFRQPASVALGEAISLGRWTWLATVAMRNELEWVLPRAAFDRWHANRDTVLQQWDRHATAPSIDPRADPLPHLRCSDVSDQKFIDTALAAGAIGLISRDRAVLKLARRAREMGLCVATPEQWLARHQHGA